MGILGINDQMQALKSFLQHPSYKDKIDLDNDVLFIDPFNYNNIVKRYNNTWLQNDTEKLSYIDNDLNKKKVNN